MDASRERWPDWPGHLRPAALRWSSSVPLESPSLAALEPRYRCRGIVLTRPQATAPFIQLDESWLEPEQHLNSGRRSDLRRARRKAEQLGQVTTEIHTPRLDELPALVDTAFAVEANSWKGDAGTASRSMPIGPSSTGSISRPPAPRGFCGYCFLRIGDRVAAMQLAVEQGGGLWLLKVGYDNRFAACSPGMLLVRDTIRYAVEAGLNTYEFLGRAESWTRSVDRNRAPLRLCSRLSVGRSRHGGAGGRRGGDAGRSLEQKIMSLLAGPRRLISKCLYPLAARAAKAYVAGEQLDDALRVAERLHERGLGTTLGYWDAPGESPRGVADAYLAGIIALAGREHSYLSIKLPSLDYSPRAGGRTGRPRGAGRVRLHFDALAPETAERTRSLVDDFIDAGAELSYTLPGRWLRSVDDAAWAIERN